MSSGGEEEIDEGGSRQNGTKKERGRKTDKNWQVIKGRRGRKGEKGRRGGGTVYRKNKERMTRGKRRTRRGRK